MITSIKFDTIQSALDAQHGWGGWFWHCADNDTATWFPYTYTQGAVMKEVKGNGFLATWKEMEAKVNGPIG